MGARETVDESGVDGSARSILVVDDHRVFAQALAASLGREQDVARVTQAHTAREALARARHDAVDAVVLDLDLPDASGLDLLADLRALHPRPLVVVLTAHARHDVAERALAAGAAAFLTKEGSLDRVLAALRATGPRPCSDVPAPDGGVDLTRREQDVLRLLAQGYDPAGIAGELNLSLHTVRGHVKTIMAKLDARTQLSAVVAAHRRGLVSVGSRY